MALIVAGTVAPMADGAEDEVFAGRVWLADDGTIAAVTRGNAPGPAGFATARTVEAGAAVIYPGLVDLHSHLGYNTLPLWADPGQTTPYLHHDSWPGEPSYQPDLSWPAWTLATHAPEALLTYVQVRALAGGSTAIQGWPATSRPATNRLVRCVDSDRIGPLADPVRVYTLTLQAADLGSRRAAMQAGSVFIYHCAEGQPGSIVMREFTDLDQQGCLQQRMVTVHTNALGAPDYNRWRTQARQVSNATPYGTVVWSPFSNLWLYGMTTDVPAARSAGLTVCLGTDWGPSGTHNLLGEAKVARLHSDAAGWDLTDLDLAQMMTCLPGDVLARAWQLPVGRLVAGALADLVLIDQRRADPWASLVAARERDVRLVMVGGRPVWGTAALMSAAGAEHASTVRDGIGVPPGHAGPAGRSDHHLELDRCAGPAGRGPNQRRPGSAGRTGRKPGSGRRPAWLGRPAGHATDRDRARHARRPASGGRPAAEGQAGGHSSDRAGVSRPGVARHHPRQGFPWRGARRSQSGVRLADSGGLQVPSRDEVIRTAQRGVELSRYFPTERRLRQPAITELDADQRALVIDVFTGLFEGLYAHLPLKRSMYGIDPVQRLRLLRLRVDQLDSLSFHYELAGIVTGLRDAHTRYVGPAELAGRAAMLPFLVEAYGPASAAALHRVQGDRRPVADRGLPVLPTRCRDPVVERGADGPSRRPARRSGDRRSGRYPASSGPGVDDLARAPVLPATGRALGDGRLPRSGWKAGRAAGELADGDGP